MNEKYISHVLVSFQSIVKKNQLFHIVFAFVGALLCLLFFFLYSTLAESYLIAICIACLFFLAVSYFVLYLYFQEQRPRKLYELCEKYRTLCKEQHIDSVGLSLEELVEALDRIPPYFLFDIRLFFSWMKKLLYLPDLSMMKEIVLLTCIEEYLEIMKKNPTSLHAHKNLAKVYGLLAEFYKNCEFDSQIRQEKYNQSILRAIEELKILKEYSPDTLWVRKELARHFQSCNMTENEIEEYEAICTLCPQDSLAFVTLGTIYFQQGKTGKGLKIYDLLKEKDPPAAQELLNFYGSSHVLTKKL
jgi:tetratricopeptide (TPR) repeat protein